MKRLTLGALVVLAASQVAGCIITSNDHESAYITANWTLKNVGSSTAAPCPPGYDTVAFYSQEVDANGNDVGPELFDVFPCNAGTATTAALAPSTYVSWIEITNSNLSPVYAQSLSAFVDVTREDKTFDAAIFIDGGYFQVDWTLEGAVSRRQLQCSDIPSISGVEITATLATTTSGSDDIFRCEAYTAFTPGLVEGSYTVVLSALRAPDDASIGNKTIYDATILPQNRVTDLGTHTIPIDGQ